MNTNIEAGEMLDGVWTGLDWGEADVSNVMRDALSQCYLSITVGGL